MRLFFNPASPYARKVMVVATECALDDRIECVEIGLSPIALNDELNVDNPLGKIPAMALDDGSVLYDSRVICEYLDALGDSNLFPVSGSERWLALRRQACADGMCDAALLARYEGFVRPAEKQWQEWSDGQRNKFRRALSSLEKEAGSFGDTCDIGTLSIAIALDYLDFRYQDEAWRSGCPVLEQWHARFSERKSLRSTLPHELGA